MTSYSLILKLLGPDLTTIYSEYILPDQNEAVLSWNVTINYLDNIRLQLPRLLDKRDQGRILRDLKKISNHKYNDSDEVVSLFRYVDNVRFAYNINGLTTPAWFRYKYDEFMMDDSFRYTIFS